MSLPELVAWYVKQPDCCAYCGLTMAEAKRLRLRTAGGYFVSWDIDKIDPSRPYELARLGNPDRQDVVVVTRSYAAMPRSSRRAFIPRRRPS